MTRSNGINHHIFKQKLPYRKFPNTGTSCSYSLGTSSFYCSRNIGTTTTYKKNSVTRVCALRYTIYAVPLTGLTSVSVWYGVKEEKRERECVSVHVCYCDLREAEKEGRKQGNQWGWYRRRWRWSGVFLEVVSAESPTVVTSVVCVASAVAVPVVLVVLRWWWWG